MDNDREPMIQKYLQEHLEELERRLANPKNNWKRREEIQEQITDVQTRIAVVERSNRRYSSSRRRSEEQPERSHESSSRPVQRVGR